LARRVLESPAVEAQRVLEAARGVVDDEVLRGMLVDETEVGRLEDPVLGLRRLGKRGEGEERSDESGLSRTARHPALHASSPRKQLGEETSADAEGLLARGCCV